MAQRFTNLIIILIVLDILFAAGGFIPADKGTTACWLSVAKNGNFSQCSEFSKVTSILAAFGTIGIVAGLFVSSRIEQVVSVSFILTLLTLIVPDIAAFYNILNNGLAGYFGEISIYISALLVAPLVVMAIFIIYDWWRSPVS